MQHTRRNVTRTALHRVTGTAQPAPRHGAVRHRPRPHRARSRRSARAVHAPAGAAEEEEEEVGGGRAAMDSTGKEREAVQLMAEAEKRVKGSHSFLRGLFG